MQRSTIYAAQLRGMLLVPRGDSDILVETVVLIILE
jgi:hypothetical protein